MDDVEEWARIAVEGASRATSDVSALRRDHEALERRVDECERGLAELERPSRLAIPSDHSIALVLERLLEQRAKSEPPDSGVEVKTAKGTRYRGTGWAVVVVSIAAILLSIIWQLESILGALRAGK